MSKDIFRIQYNNPKKSKISVLRPNSKYDLSEEWQVSKHSQTSQFASKLKPLSILNYVLIGIVLIFVFRLFALQVIKGRDYLIKSESNRLRTQVIEAPRGIFYDQSGVPLVKNKPAFYLAYLPSDLPSEEIFEEQLKIISAATNYNQSELKDIISNNPAISYKSLPLIDSLTYEEVVALKTNLKNWSGFELGTRGAREYIYRDSISHILGYMGLISEKDISNPLFGNYRLTDYVGKSGLEMEYEKFLRGEPGSRDVEIDVRGKIQKVINEKEPVSGNNIKISIDIEIQNKLYELILSQLEKSNLTKGAAVAINPKNGEVLAAVSLPSFDNNIFSNKISFEDYQNLINNPSLPLFFRPFQGEYPSGSIIKPLIALAALEKKIITPSTTILSQGGIRIQSWFFPDWKAGGHGLTNLTKAIAESVNTYFFAIGGGYGNIEGLGIEGITSFAKKFFFTQKSDIDFPSEAEGFLPSKEWKQEVKNERWYIGDTYNVSIGQGDVLITPLQITNFMAYLANGGIMYKPHFIKEIIKPDGEITVYEPEIVQRNLVDQQNIKAVREGLKATVEWGSARSLNSLYPFVVAGKTGTAQVSGDKEPHAWFTSFAPYDNPTISLTILVENGIGGSENAVPIAREFYKWYKEKY